MVDVWKIFLDVTKIELNIYDLGMVCILKNVENHRSMWLGGNRVVLQSARISNITNSIIINLYYACAYYISYRLRGRRPGAIPYIHYIKYIIAMVVQRRHNIIVVWSWISCALYNRIYIGTLWRTIVVYILYGVRVTRLQMHQRRWPAVADFNFYLYYNNVLYINRPSSFFSLALRSENAIRYKIKRLI